MSESKPFDDQGLGDAIRAQRTSADGTDLDSIDRTLVKSGLWKKLTLERIESARGGGTAGGAREILRQVKLAMGDVVERFWPDLVRSAAAQSDHAEGQRLANPANDDDARREATNARKLLALHESTMRSARRRLYEQWARVYVHGKRIDSLLARISGIESTHSRAIEEQRDRYAKLEDAFDEFQKEADQLLDRLDRENLLLKAEARKAAR